MRHFSISVLLVNLPIPTKAQNGHRSLLAATKSNCHSNWIFETALQLKIAAFSVKFFNTKPLQSLMTYEGTHFTCGHTPHFRRHFCKTQKAFAFMTK